MSSVQTGSSLDEVNGGGFELEKVLSTTDNRELVRTGFQPSKPDVYLVQ